MYKKISLYCHLLMAIFMLTSASCAASPLDGNNDVPNPVTAMLMHENDTIQPEHPFYVAIKMELDDHWHAYWQNPGETGMAPNVTWTLPDGFTVGPIQWPTPKKIKKGQATSFGYENEVILLAEIIPPKNLSDVNNPVELKANVNWVVCDEFSCLPGGDTLAVSLFVSDQTPKPNVKHQKAFATAHARLPKSNSSIQVEKQNDLIILQMETENDIAKAQFFPLDLGRIDDEVEAVLTKSSEHANTYHIILKELNTTEENLQGVVVLFSNDESGKILESYTIDLPVIDTVQDELAMNETELPLNSFQSKPLTNNEFQGGFILALGLAFLGGLILNLMPCVLPVISFKILSFVKMAGQSRALIFKHGVAFSVGILLSFWALAGVLLMMRAYGHAVGWGFQLQDPLFVSILAAIIWVFSLSLFGVFEIGTGFASLAGNTQGAASSSDGLHTSFFSGILATAIATPCTGPFLGTAVGFAVTLSAPLAMLIFTSLGLGMAFPYFLIGAFPKLLRFFPKPGNWMITFKEILGFMMLATVLWLVWVFGAQTDTQALFLLLSGFFFLSIGSWIYGKWGTPIQKKATRFLSYALTLVCVGLGGYTIFSGASSPSLNTAQNGQIAADGEWENFSPERIIELQKQGIPVFVDFTAKWCLICQANHLVLSTEEVNHKFANLGVVKMKADWTKSDPVITEELGKFGRNSVPLYLLFGASPQTPPVILPQVLTPEIILSHLEKVQTTVSQN